MVKIAGMKKLYFLWIILFCCSLQTQARHLAGGYLTYTCLGNDEYRFALHMFRDCNCFSCAAFDAEISIGVYQCEPGSDCVEQDQGDAVAEGLIPLASQAAIEVPTPECLGGPPFICLEEGIYEFTATLAASEQSYYIVYQRCCRNFLISNIQDPDNSGFSVSTELTPEAMVGCNNAPQFSRDSIFFACVNDPMNLDLSFTEADGDVLVYEFCSPVNGGGPLLSPETYWTCEGALPTPACPPPFDTLLFEQGLNSQKPLFGNPPIQLNSSTGFLTGTPSFNGLYLIGMCVSEYRNGEKMSETRLEFELVVGTGVSVSTGENLRYGKLNVYPNPVGTELWIELPTNEDSYQLQLWDWKGRKHINVAGLNGSQYKVEIPELPAGIYLVELFNDRGRFRSTIIKR